MPRSVLVYAFRRPNRQASVPAYIGARKIHDAIEKYSSRTSCTIPFLRPVVFSLPIVLPFFMALDIKNKFHRYRGPQSSRRRAEHQLRAPSQARAAIPRVPHFRQSAALAPNPGTSNFRSNFADNKPLPLPFLIANPRLEIDLTHSKESLLKISNREEIAFFSGQFASRPYSVTILVPLPPKTCPGNCPRIYLGTRLAFPRKHDFSFHGII